MQNYVDKYLGDNKQSKFDAYLEKTRQKYVLRSANLRSHKHILDIGGGVSTYFAFIKNWDTYTIIEPVEQFSKYLKEFYDDYQIEMICDRFENTRLKQDYDFIVVSSVLHLVEDVDKFLTTLHDVCNYKTIIYINVPNKVSFHRLLGEKMGMLYSMSSLSSRDVEFSHKHTFDRKRLWECLSRNGFNVIVQGSYLIKPFDEEKMSQIVDEDVVDGLEKMISYFPDMGCEIYAEAKSIG